MISGLDFGGFREWIRSGLGVSFFWFERGSDHPERRLGGVAAAIAHGLAAPVVVVRVAFVLLTLFVFHVGPLVYGVGWLMLPYAPDDEPPLERALGNVLDTLRRWRQAGSPPGGPVA